MNRKMRVGFREGFFFSVEGERKKNSYVEFSLCWLVGDDARSGEV